MRNNPQGSGLEVFDTHIIIFLKKCRLNNEKTFEGRDAFGSLFLS